MTFKELFQDRPVAWGSGPLPSADVTSLCYESQKAGDGSVFFCLRGQKHDGHSFAKDAYMRGCRFFVAEEPLGLPEDATVLLCQGSRREMARLAARYYGAPGERLMLIGITGTKGKTTTALMLRELLERTGTQAAYIGSLGVMIGKERYPTANTTPESVELHKYLRMIEQAGIRVVILEVSSQALARDRIAGLSFRLAVFTNLTRDHIGDGEHRSMEEYQNAKLLLFTKHSSGKVILNCEDRFSDLVFSHRKREDCIFYGNCRNSMIKAVNIHENKVDNRFCTDFVIAVGEKHHFGRLFFAGRHYVMDLMAALCAACELTGKAPCDFMPFVSDLRAEGRCEAVPIQGAGTFVIDYAHNGASLAAALQGLRPYVAGKLYCLFGAVGERSQCRRRDMALAASSYADFSVITEDNPGDEDPATIFEEILKGFPRRSCVTVIPDREAAILHLLRISKEGDIVLLAGKGNEGYQLRGASRCPFSEVEILERYRKDFAT